jgi:phosphoribosyl 1,2-cyclic phosphate phosphodiesterase
VGECRLVIDAGPDFRQQMLCQGVSHLSAILLTHKHKDHTGGLDEVRALNFVDYPTVRPVDIYATAETIACVRKDYDYAFAEPRYRGVPELRLHEIDVHSPFEVEGVEIVPVLGRHLAIDVVGYRIGDVGYMTDFKHIEPAELAKMRGVRVLVVNALRFAPHDSHFSVAEALDVVATIAPERAILTHLSHDAGLHAEIEAALPAGVEVGYDGLRVEI